MLIAYGLLLIAIAMDIKAMRISNRLILVGLGLAFICRFLSEGILGVGIALFQISFPVILLYLLFLAGILGAGDIKLFSLIGGFVNFKVLFWCIVYAFLTGAGMSLLKLLCSGRLVRGIRSGYQYVQGLLRGELKEYAVQEDNHIHFSIAILCGLVIAHAQYG